MNSARRWPKVSQPIPPFGLIHLFAPLHCYVALKNKEEELRTELGAEITKLQAETDRIRNDAANMASMYESQKAYMELQMQQMNDTAEANRNALVAEYEGKLQEMENKIQQGTNSAELTRLRAQILSLEKQIAEKPRGGGGGCIIL